MSYMTVCRWVGRLKSAHLQLKVTQAALQQQRQNLTLKEILKKDAVRLYTFRQLTRMTNLSLARVYCILKEHLRLCKINASCIPHLLTDIPS